MKDSAMWAQVNQRWSALSLIFFYNAGSVGVQGATRLKPCNFGHLPTVLSLCAPTQKMRKTGAEGMCYDQRKRDGKIYRGMPQEEGDDPAGTRGSAACDRPGGVQVGDRSFP